ncbi:MAG: TIGR00375 family protein [Euryarchaeota archaeon]|nr:TIGR00375 family protein [Euryarchaeota archaeon]
MRISVDFHLHSKYSYATSKKMEIPLIAREAELKGLDVVGTADVFHPSWTSHLKKSLERVEEGTYERGGVRFIITVEVEDKRRVHHLILLPSFSKAEELYEEFKKYSNDIDTNGRCHLRLGGDEIVERVKSADGIMGPAHAFTPWTALYGEHDSLKDCYGEYADKIDFLELGLSADSELADHISELRDLTFLSNSDAHSPWPHRLGREFNIIELEKKTYTEILEAIHRKNGRRFVQNVGLNPVLGKYHKTACIDCHEIYTLKQAVERKWKCKCGGRIKKGVYDRIMELKDQEKGPEDRPPYLRIAPLSEIIALKKRYSLSSKNNLVLYKKFLREFNDEIEILVNAEYNELKKIDKKVASYILSYREEKLEITPGGGGQYGKLHLAKTELDKWIT